MFYTLELGVRRPGEALSDDEERHEPVPPALGFCVVCGLIVVLTVRVERCTINEMLSRSEYLQENVQIPTVVVFSSVGGNNSVELRIKLTKLQNSIYLFS